MNKGYTKTVLKFKNVIIVKKYPLKHYSIFIPLKEKLLIVLFLIQIIIVKPNTFCENRRIWANFFHAVSKYFPRGDNIMIKRRHAYALFSQDINLWFYDMIGIEGFSIIRVSAGHIYIYLFSVLYDFIAISNAITHHPNGLNNYDKFNHYYIQFVHN